MLILFMTVSIGVVIVVIHVNLSVELCKDLIMEVVSVYHLQLNKEKK